jgi:mRNA interferase MazF
MVKRFEVHLVNKEGQIILDQIRTVDKSRPVKKVGVISSREKQDVINILRKMFS